MKVRIRFSKTGALVYIGHLDVMRYFQKLFRRADIPVKYSEGFSPHQILSFTPPLPLGMESGGEYADVELTESIPTEQALTRLRGQSVSEIGIMSFKQLPAGCENAMASVKAAAYSVVFADDEDIPDIVELTGMFLETENINVMKKTKKNESMINIRPLVYSLSADNDNRRIDMIISSGSTDNIKPELVTDTLSGFCKDGICLPADMSIKRIDQYMRIDDRLVSLDEIGSDITI